MKKYLLIILLVFVFVFTFATMASAGTYTDESGMTWCFSVNESQKTATITSGTTIKEGTDRSVEINIPSVVYIGDKAYTVTKISSEAFKCGSNNNSNEYLSKKYFGHLTIPDTVTDIGSYAFAYSAIYGDVVIPDSVTSIGEGAFMGCIGISSVKFPSGLDTVPVNCFRDCKSLTEFKTDGTIAKYMRECFRECVALYDIDISSSTTTIQDNAFYNCASLHGALHFESIQSLGSNAFCNCAGIEDVYFEEFVFNTNVFSGCQGLKNFYVSEYNTKYATVDGILFSKDLKTLYRYPMGKLLSEYTIPDSVEIIDSYAFAGCGGSSGLLTSNHYVYLKKIVIGPNVTTIRNNAFQYTSVTDMYFPSNVTSVGENVLSNCPNLVWVIFESSITKLYGNMLNSTPMLRNVISKASSVENNGSNPGGTKFSFYIPSRDCEINYEGHYYGYSDIAPTCTTSGKNICLLCGNETVVERLNHSGRILSTSEYSCTTNESVTIDCVNCHQIVEVVSIESPGSHLFEDFTTIDVSTNGYASYIIGKCSRCSNVIVQEFSANTLVLGDVNRDYVVDDKDILLLANIISNLSTIENISICDFNNDKVLNVTDLIMLKKYVENKSFALSSNVEGCSHHYHTKEITLREEDCFSDGVDILYCTDCEEVIDTIVTKSKGHSFSTIESTVKEATCTTPGEYQRICARCNSTETIHLDPVPHDHSWWMLSDNERDYEYSYCKNCGLLESREIHRESLDSMISMFAENYSQYYTPESAGLVKPIIDNSKRALTQEQVDMMTEEIRKILPTLQYKIEDVPVVYIETVNNLGKEYKDAKIAVTYYDENGVLQTITDTEGSIKVRGNSTAGYSKKQPYNFKFSRSIDLLGLGDGKKYTLIANAFDNSLIRNAISIELANELGLENSSKYRFVDVYVNGVAKGSYMLVTPFEIGKERVNIDEESDFIILLSRSNHDGAPAVTTPIFAMGALHIESPEEFTPKNRSEIFKLMYQLDFAILSGKLDEVAKYADIDSIISYFVLHEYLKDKDMLWDSTRFYVKDGKLYGGPVWDMDLTMGNISRGNGTSINSTNAYWEPFDAEYEPGDNYRCAYGTWANAEWTARNNWQGGEVAWWYYYLWKYSDEFNVEVAKYIQSHQDVLSNLYEPIINKETGGTINALVDRLAFGPAMESFIRNFQIHNASDFGGRGLMSNITITRLDTVEYIREWLRLRNEWLLDYYTKTYLEEE